MPCGVGGGGTHRSWPGGRGGRPRALVVGEGWGGRRGDGREGWGLVGCSKEEQGRGQGRVGLAVGGGCKGFGCGGVGGRGTGPRDEQISQRVSCFCGFFEGCPVGWAWRGKAGWVPTRAGLVDGAGAGLVDGQGP